MNVYIMYGQILTIWLLSEEEKKTKGKFLYLVRWMDGWTMIILCCSKNNKISSSSISSK